MVKWLPLLALAACVRPPDPTTWTVTVAPPDGQQAVLDAARDVAAGMGCEPTWGGWIEWRAAPFDCGGVLASGCSPITTAGAYAIVVYQPRAADTALAYELGHYVSAECGFGWADLGPELDAWAATVNTKARGLEH